MTDDSPSSNSAAGHRERLRARFLAAEASATTEASLLELLLTYSIPRRDVRPLAEALLAEFGSLEAVLSATPDDLQRVRGIKESSAVLLKLAGALASAAAAPEAAPEIRDEAPAAPPEPEVETPETSSVPPDRPDEDPPPAAKAPKRAGSSKSGDPPKLQVSNGYLLEPAQNAQVLDFIAGRPEAKKITRSEIVEATGLSDRQIESLASVSTALGLMVPRSQLLTPLGALVHKYDLFLDSAITLEFCHFLGAGRARNLVWHLIFNELLHSEKPTDQSGWSNWLRERLAGRYSDRSLVKHIAEEVRFVLDAYAIKNFKKLNLIYETPDKTLALRRYTALLPQSLAAMIYWIGEQHEARLVSFGDLQAEAGSPGRVFGLDASSMRPMVELLHQKGWIRYEVRHGLDQVRLIDGFDPASFLVAGYENREPEPNATPARPGDEPLLL